MLTRPVNEKHYAAGNTVPHIHDPRQYSNGILLRSAGGGLALPYRGQPLMRVGHGGVIPAAQDPTDPSTWQVPVVFT